MKDSDRLLYNADHDSINTNPCEDFKTFGMGDFYEHRVANDRYGEVSFNEDANREHYERLKRMLLKPITENEPKMFKIMKSFLRQCSDFRRVENRGASEVLNYGRKLGIVRKSPFKDDEKGSPFKTVMLSMPQTTLSLFFDHAVFFCSKGPEEMLCLKHSDFYKYSEALASDEYLTLKNLKVDENYKKQVVNDYVSFLLLKEKVQESSTNFEPRIFTIAELSEKFPSPHLDWLSIINNCLLNDSKRTLGDKIVVLRPQLLGRLHKIFVELEESFLKNIVASAFISWNEGFFTSQVFFGLSDKQRYGHKRPMQRFELCLNLINAEMSPALETLTAVTFRDEFVQNSATEFVELAVSDTIERISNFKDDKIVPQKIRNLMVQKLEKVKLWVFFPEEIFNITKIGEFYDELDFEGSENAVELYEKMKNHNRKMWTRPKDDWIRIVQKITTSVVLSFFTDLNVIYVPSSWSFYPRFHPNRPRFFNMATLYANVIVQIRNGLKNEHSFRNLSGLIDHWTLADRSYVKWEANGGVDLQLPAFKLTNRQMLWVSLLNTNAEKFVNNPSTSVYNIKISKNKNANLIFKAYNGFREAFRCGNLTSLEKEQIQKVF